MKLKQKVFGKILIAAALIATTVLGFFLYLPHASYGFSREISPGEKDLRTKIVSTALRRLGTLEGSAEHQAILDIYNAHEPLAQDYEVQLTDSWCATFVSAVAIEAELTDIIPTECGCERQIGLFQQMDRWQEQDTYLPLPGDYIFYAWDEDILGDCTGWADHVGIVVGTWGPFIKVIEGNKDDAVSIRYTTRFDPTIRGYGLPDYAAKVTDPQS